MNDALNQLLGRSNGPEPGQVARVEQIADLACTAQGLGEQAGVTVQQLACVEPGCRPRATCWRLCANTRPGDELRAAGGARDDDPVTAATTSGETAHIARRSGPIHVLTVT